MPTDRCAKLAAVRRFDQLVAYLRDEMGWPIGRDDFEELTFEYTPEELGIDAKNAAKIDEIKRLRPLSAAQPWGIFFVKFEPKRLPVVALRRILGQVVLKKRASAKAADRAVWAADDLLFVSNYGEGDERRIAFAHFSQAEARQDLPTLKVLGWDNLDTPLHLGNVAEELTTHLAWPEDERDAAAWRQRWRSAFTLRHREAITTSRELSIRLAELACAIRDRIKTALPIETERGPLTKLMKAFHEALVHDLDADGFADMYAQTIAYGLLSARIAEPHKKTADDFAGHMRTNPFLRELMETFLKVGGRRGKAGGPGIDFDELGVSEVVELLDDPRTNMEAVVRDFGDRNPQEDPVIHFYELFLKEYDAKRRMQRGVFYTPRPVVSYIVRSVDEVLRTEFGLGDGLADTATWGEMAKRHEGLTIPEGAKPTDRFVTILDPATGTGTFLVEVIEVIHCTLVEKWKREGHDEKKMLDLWNDYVPTHLLPRLHGYELLMAPYAIAHLKIGLKLHETGYRFESDERARIFLTNALDPGSAQSVAVGILPALAREADAVNAVKLHRRFTVVIGNPPYSRASSNKGEYIEMLVGPYKAAVRDEKNIQPLSDDYIKFIRLSEVLLQQAGVGVHGMITNNTFLSGRIHRGIRESLCKTFTLAFILNLHGSGNVAFLGDGGSGDRNVFDILQGVAVAVLARVQKAARHIDRYAELVGGREWKYNLLASRSDLKWQQLTPEAPYFLWVPRVSTGGKEYHTYSSLSEIFSFCSVSGKPGDDDLLVSFSREEVLPKLRGFQRALRSETPPRLTEAGRNLAARPADKPLHGALTIPYAYRPFDTRYTYYDADVWTRAVKPLKSCVDGSLVLLTTKIIKDAQFSHVFVTKQFPDVIFLSNTSSVNCFAFPANYHSEVTGLGFEHGELNVNLNPKPFAARLGRTVSGRESFNYIYAILHSPVYRERYYEQLQYDFPRVPLTSSFELFGELTRLGDDLVALHLVEAPVQQTLSGRYDKAANTWRYEVGKGQCLPVTLSFNGAEKSVVGNVGWSDDTVWIDAVKPKKGAADAEVTGTVGFRGVSEEVWSFHIGGYKVCQKWLKDRKDRTLTAEDITHYHRIVIALSETIRLMREIDEVIDAHGGWPGAFLSADAAQEPAERVLRVAEPPGEYGSGKGNP